MISHTGFYWIGKTRNKNRAFNGPQQQTVDWWSDRPGDGILIKIIFGSLLGKGYVMFSTRRTTCLLDIIEAGNWRSQMIKCCRLKCYFYRPESHSLFAIHCHLNESLRTQLTAPELRSSFNTRSHRKMHFCEFSFQHLWLQSIDDHDNYTCSLFPLNLIGDPNRNA